ncbi:hypothetical protein EON65_45975 [archaeon]|nr:MAG: hypothetical protein EON65_45975 [archaeon]
MTTIDLASVRQKALDDFYAVVPTALRHNRLCTIRPFIRDPYYLTHPIQSMSPVRHLHDIRRHQDKVLGELAGHSIQSFQPLSRVASSSLHDKAIGVTHFAFDRAGSLLAVSTGSGVVSVYDVDELQLSFRNKYETCCTI